MTSARTGRAIPVRGGVTLAGVIMLEWKAADRQQQVPAPTDKTRHDAQRPRP
ncbi:hypothetical protein IG631_12026 [Alternaria alternata]|nr:hypothetical protein IG631_12026 [Alternaria alternata]